MTTTRKTNPLLQEILQCELEWTYWRPLPVASSSVWVFSPPSCVDTGFCGAALYSRTGKWDRIKATIFSFIRKDQIDSHKGEHNGLRKHGLGIHGNTLCWHCSVTGSYDWTIKSFQNSNSLFHCRYDKALRPHPRSLHSLKHKWLMRADMK